MLKAVDDVWELLTAFDLTNGKDKPGVKGFMSTMEGNIQKRGYYRDNVVYIHTDLETQCPLLRKVALEEVVHHVTGAGDMSREIQDFLFRLIVKIAW
jgi:hypothetical protein